MANNLAHFEFMVNDPEKAKEFYSAVFDWKISVSQMPGYSMIDAGKEPGGGIMKKPAEAPHVGLSVYFHVESIDETLKKVEGAGGKIGYPRTEIPEIGWWALFFDPEGIPVSLFESK
jgi:predicted enzyme related to lactoylglutathione lyase